MNAPLIWIILPILLAGGLYPLRRWYRITIILGGVLTILFAVLAYWHPIDELIIIGPITYRINSVLIIFGRRFILDNTERPILAVTYLSTAFWFAGAYIARAGRLFVPIALVIVSLLTAAIAVEPFLYAALIIELVVLVSVPLLSPPGQPLVRGVLRFITFQSFGMPFILFVGWMLAGVDASPGNFELVVRAMILLGLGFAFLLGIFPFHTWIPILADQVHPYVFSFVLVTLSWMVSLFGLGFFERYVWLRNTEAVYSMIRVWGVIMIFAGGVWAALQISLPRIMGYAVMVEIGFSLIAVSIPGSLSLFFALLLPRLLGLGLWSLSLSSIKMLQKNNGPASMTISSLRGIAGRMPVAAACIVIVNLSIAGFPLLATFPTRLALLRGLAEFSAGLATLCLLGSVGLIVAGLRSLTLFQVNAKDLPWKINESYMLLVFLILGIVALFLMGIFPNWYLQPLRNLALAFGQLNP